MKNRFWKTLIFLCIANTSFYAQSTLLPPVSFNEEPEEVEQEELPSKEEVLVEEEEKVPSSFKISEFGIKTRGEWNEEKSAMVLSSSANFAIDFSTGKDVVAEVGLALDAFDVEKLLNDPQTVSKGSLALQFIRSSLAVKNINETPVFFRFFVGKDRKLGSGAIFSQEFQSEAVRPLFEKTSSNAEVYNGIHQVIGTGIQLGLKPAKSNYSTSIFLYQDSVKATNVGVYAADLTWAYDSPKFKASAFCGYSFPTEEKGIFRTGAMLYFTNKRGSALYSEFGIPNFIVGKEFLIDDMYILFEPQTILGGANLSLTFFYNPKFYLEKAVEEGGNIDIAARVSFGNPRETSITGGLESSVTLSPDKEEKLYRIFLSPFFSIRTAQASWGLKLNVNPLEYKNPKNMFSFNISIKADF